MARLVNQHAADCFECSQPVAAEAGTLERWQGRWLVRHPACDERSAPIDAAIEARNANVGRTSATPPTVCLRHGELLDGRGCWECNAEADEARRDDDERIAVAEFKMHRDGF